MAILCSIVYWITKIGESYPVIKRQRNVVFDIVHRFKAHEALSNDSFSRDPSAARLLRGNYSRSSCEKLDGEWLSKSPTPQSTTAFFSQGRKKLYKKVSSLCCLLKMVNPDVKTISVVTELLHDGFQTVFAELSLENWLLEFYTILYTFLKRQSFISRLHFSSTIKIDFF